MAQPVRAPATVESVQRHSEHVATYRLQAHRRLPRFVPGQFVHLTLDAFDPAGFWPESRVFSVANAVADRRSLTLTISRQGAYTSRILDSLRAGDEVWIKGPYGEFTIDGHGCRHAVLIAGGTGITPFCALMDASLAAGALPLDSVALHYGARSPHLLVYRALAERCAAALPGFSLRCYAETDAGSGIDTDITLGRMSAAEIAATALAPADTAFYLSGPRAMVSSFQHELLQDHGIPAQHVIIDAWE
jgi:ferredoxin-NADP reductase